VPELPEGLSDRTNVELMTLNDAVAAADVVAVLVAHDRFRNLNRGAVSAKIVVDAVGLLAQPLEAA
jgi:UDP-N-acetyl-D-mannosaminuronic acid dehydrogenase